MEYSRNFGSNFPSSLIEVGTKKDVDDTVIALINQYYKYMSSNDIKSANELYQVNKEVLEPYSIKMKDFNLLLEETYNIGLELLNKATIIVNETQPETMSNNSIWYEVLEDIE